MINEVRLDEICVVIAGQSPPSDSYNQDKNGVPFFQGKADFGSLYPTVRYWCNKPTKISLPNDILFSVRAPVGPTNINNIEACIGRGLSALRCKKDILEMKYLLHYLRVNEKKISDLGTGSTFKAITISELKKLKIPLPPLPQQQKIANILDAAATLKQNDKALIAKYDALTQALFLEMFGDPVRNPKGWEKVTLKHFGKISTGNTPSRSEDENYSSKHIEWIKTDNIKENYLYITQAGEYLSEVGLSRARSVEKDAILVACIAGSIESIGRAALTDRKVSFNQQINAIEPNSKVNPKYLYYLIRNCKKHIQNHASNGMKRMLTKGEFEKILMISPPIELQNQFAARVTLIEQQKAIAQKSLEKSEALCNSLLQKAFNGGLT